MIISCLSVASDIVVVVYVVVSVKYFDLVFLVVVDVLTAFRFLFPLASLLAVIDTATDDTTDDTPTKQLTYQSFHHYQIQHIPSPTFVFSLVPLVTLRQ